MPSKPSGSGNSFGTFLESLDTKRSVQSARQAPHTVLEVLQRASGGDVQVRDLMHDLGMDVVELARTVSGMQEAGLIELVGTGSDQVARLTSTGAALLKIGNQ